MAEHGQYGPCAAQCGRKAHLRYSNYCCTCSRRIARNGSPHAIALRTEAELGPYRKAIAEALARHRNTKAVRNALTLATELLNWQPAHDFTVHYQVRERMQVLLNFGVTPEQVVQRVCEFVSWLADHPIEKKREQDAKLATQVIKLAPLRGWHKRAHVLLKIAQLITEDGLWRFACGLRMRMEQDHADRVQLVKDLGDYSS